MKPNRFRRFVSNSLPATMFLAASAATVTTSFAVDTFWDGSDSTDWATGANWDTTNVPTNADKAFVNNITVNTPVVTADSEVSELLVGFTSTTGQVDVTAGTLTSGGWTVIGNGATGDGTVNISGSGAVVTNTIFGNFQIAEVAGSTGLVTVNTTAPTGLTTGELIVGNGGTGTLTVDNGDVSVVDNRVGTNATGASGTVNLNGGDMTIDGFARWGASENSVADVNIAAGTTMTINNSGAVAESLRVGEGAGSSSTVDVDGTLDITGNVRVGHNSNSTVADTTVNVNSGGILNSENDLLLGYAGASGSTAELNIDDGTVNVATTTERWVVMSQWDGTSVTTNITNGGTLNLNTNTDIRFGTQNNSGTHELTVDGGSIVGYADNGTTIDGATTDIELGRNSNPISVTLNIENGGSVACRSIFTNANTTSAIVNFDDGTLRATVSDGNWISLNGTGTREVNILAGGATFNTAGYDMTIDNPLLEDAVSTGGGISVEGSGGSLTLAGASTYTGATDIDGAELIVNLGATIDGTSAVNVTGGGQLTLLNDLAAGPLVTITSGTLDGDATIGGSVSVASSASNTVSAGNGGVGVLTIDDILSFSGAAAIDLQATGDTMDQSIIVNGTLSTPTTGLGQLKVNATNTQPLWTGSGAGVDYPIIDYSGGTFSGGLSDFSVGTLDPPLIGGQTAAIVDTGSEIALRITGTLTSWTALTDNNLDDDTVNFNDGSSDVAFTAGGIAVFGDGSANPSVNVVESFLPGAVLFNNFSDDYLFSGSFGFDGATSVTVTDGGLVEFSNVNGYTGSTAITDGMIVLSGTGSISSSSSINLGDDGTLVFEPTGSVTYANPITGTGTDNSYVSAEAAVTMRGTGTLTLSGANTFTGDFALDSGQLNLDNAGALGAGPGVIIINGGTLDNTSGGTINMAPNKEVEWNGDFSFIGSNDLYLSNGAVTMDASHAVDVQGGVFGMGAPGDGGAGYDITKTGTGTLVLNGGDIAGNLDIQSGTVGLNQDLVCAAPIDSNGATGGTGILQNEGAVGTKWIYLTDDTDQTSDVLIRDRDPLAVHTFRLGLVKRGTGSLTLTNSANTVSSQLQVESGTLVAEDGTYKRIDADGTSVLIGAAAIVGLDAGETGVLKIDGATVDFHNATNADEEVYRASLDIGRNATGAGAVDLISGSLDVHRQMAVGATGGAYASFSQTGGAADVGGFLAIGLGTSQGVVNLSGGTYAQGGPVTDAAGAGSWGVMSLSGTADYDQTSTGDSGLWVGENGTGFLNVSDSATLDIVAANDGLQVGRNASGVGTVNLLGGTTTVQKVYQGAGTGTLNFNGGTLAANTATTTFLTGLTNAYVHSGGGTIDNNGNAITIGQGLQPPTGDGVDLSGLIPSGSGFIGAPTVDVQGGGGTGATAVAEIDASGNLTGITVTNPGIGYTSLPVLQIAGGGIGIGASISIGGSSALVPNVSGGMTFTGAATTTLTGVNRYTGDTTIDAGTTVLVANGAEISVAPTTDMVSSKITGSGAISFQGKLRVDATNADITDGNSWTVVDVTSPTYDSTFGVAIAGVLDLTPQGDGVTHIGVDGSNTWTYSETTGVLSLAVAAGGSFESWISGFTVADDTPSGNSDADTLANVGEYWHDNDPEVSEGSAVSVVETGGNLVLTFQRSDLAQSNGDVTGHVEYGSDLAGWTRVAVPAASSVVGGVTFTITDGSPTDTVVASVPITATEFFARLVYVK